MIHEIILSVIIAALVLFIFLQEKRHRRSAAMFTRYNNLVDQQQKLLTEHTGEIRARLNNIDANIAATNLKMGAQDDGAGWLP